MTDTTEVERHPLFGTDVVRATDYDALAAKLAEWQAAQHYTYIGKDGKPVLARDLEARADAAEAALPAVYRLAMGDASRLMRPMLRSLIAREHAMQDIRALPTPTAAELMARIQTGEKE